MPAKKGRGRPPKSAVSSQQPAIVDNAAIASQKSLIDGNNNDDHIVSAHTQSQTEMEREPSNDREVAVEENDNESGSVAQDHTALVTNSDLEPEIKEKFLATMADNEMNLEQIFVFGYRDDKRWQPTEEMIEVAKFMRSAKNKKDRYDAKMKAVANEEAKWDSYDNDKRYNLFRFWQKKKPALLKHLVTEDNGRQAWFLQEKEQRAEDKAKRNAAFKQMAAANRERIKNLSSSQKEARNEKIRGKTKATRERAQAGLILPVNRIRRNFKQQYPKHKQSKETAIFMAAVMEYLAAEVLELAGNNAETRNTKKRDKETGEIIHYKSRITPRDIMMATMQDDEINTFLGKNIQFIGAGTYPAGILPMLKKTGCTSMTNAEWYGHGERGCTTLYQRDIMQEQM